MTSTVDKSANWRDSWRLAIGTLTALPVRPPHIVDRGVARAAMLIGPAAVLPLGIMVAAIGRIGQALGLPGMVTALLAIGALALGSRGFHLDGLSDTADGLAASYDRARCLAVMKSGTAGPAGVITLIVVVGLQVSALAALVDRPGGALAAGIVVVVARAALAPCCARGIPSARPDGLGATYTGTVPWACVALVWGVAAAALTIAAGLAGFVLWRGVLAAAVALVVVVVLLCHTHRRFGGVTGDVFGAAVELTLTALLVALA